MFYSYTDEIDASETDDFLQILQFLQKQTDQPLGPTDERTNGSTDGHTLLKRALSEKNQKQKLFQFFE